MPRLKRIYVLTSKMKQSVQSHYAKCRFYLTVCYNLDSQTVIIYGFPSHHQPKIWYSMKIESIKEPESLAQI